jgi:hypothetical protein
MRDLLLSALSIPMLAAITRDDLSFWEKLLEKWGIGLIGIGLFCALAWWTARREKTLNEERVHREVDFQTTIVKLAQENNRLQEENKTQSLNHAHRLEGLILSGNVSREHHAAALRLLVRKLQKLPCVGDIDEQELPGTELWSREARLENYEGHGS